MKDYKIRPFFLFYLVLLIPIVKTYAQPFETNPDFKRANHWFFGDSVWLDFNYNPPLKRNGSQLSAYEPSTSFSDKDGNLIVYSDGITIWNNKHEVIHNGSGILGHFSSSQGAIFISQPNNDSFLFLFTTDAYCGNNGLRYTIIKVHDNPDSIIVIEKNTFIANSLTESINVTKHENNIDYWIVVHSSTGNTFFSYLLTEEGLINCPVTTQIGYIFDGHSLNCQTIGDFNLQGNKLVLSVFRDFKVISLDFSKSTGKFSNYQQFDDIAFPTGLNFSNNNSYVYVVERDKGIKRINLADNSFDTITQINAFDYFVIKTALTPHGDIYCNVFDSSHIAAISNIDSVNPKFELKSFNIGNKKLTNGLPNFNKSYFYSPSVNFTYNLNCLDNTILFYGLDTFNANNHIWDISKQGSSVMTANTKEPLIQFGDTGIYQVRYIASNGTRRDTIIKEINILPKINKSFLGNDTGWCENINDSIIIKAPIGMHCYEWSTGETTPQITIDATGTYIAKITTPNFCVLYDTISITVDSIPETHIIYQNHDTLKTDAIAKGYQWYRNNQPIGTNQPYLKLVDTGIYHLEVTTPSGCKSISDSFQVHQIGLNKINLQNIRVYPNPFSNKIHFEIDKPIIVEIHNSIGQLILSEKLTISEKTVNTSYFKQGIYFIKITTESGQVYNYKLVNQPMN